MFKTANAIKTPYTVSTSPSSDVNK